MTGGLSGWRQFWRRLRRRNGWSKRHLWPEIRFIEVPKPEAPETGEQTHRSLFPGAPAPQEPLPARRLENPLPPVRRLPELRWQLEKLEGQELRGGEERRETLQELVAALGVRPADPRQSEAHLRAWLELTTRQKQVVCLACAGHTNLEIAKRLRISTNTVKGHLTLALQRFGVRSRAELRVALAGWDFSRLKLD